MIGREGHTVDVSLKSIIIDFGQNRRRCPCQFFLSRQIILPVVLYGCKTWSLTLREESRLRAFENKILRRIFGPKRDANREWRRLHDEELHSLDRLPNIIRVVKSRRLTWAGHVARMEEVGVLSKS